MIPRGEGSYPTGEFDCGCIYASPPVMDSENNLWIYYMGGNGKHTNFRETSLARAKWQPDRFAAMVPKRPEEETLLTSNRMRFMGSSLEILAEPLDKDKAVSLQCQLHHIWTSPPIEGFEYEKSRVFETGDGWYRIQWPSGMERLDGEKGCMKLKLKNLKVWAVRGDICLDGHRLWKVPIWKMRDFNDYSK